MRHTPSNRQLLPFILFTALITGIPDACSHLDRMSDIDHLVRIDAATSYVNIEVVLHFHEIPSEQAMKERMDINGDGKITSSELDLYCSTLEQRLLRRFSLQVNGKPVPLISLYRPEVDLWGNETVQRAPHLLRVFLTAVLPSSTTESSLLRFEDRSFVSTPGQARMEIRDALNRQERVLKASSSRDIIFRLLDIHTRPANPYHPTFIPVTQEENCETSSQ